ncbi:porin family protein [Aggregatimonas sangjinii]|uniref:Porin family protein n=1 Tax=Aggregatimonas sangjinii TaxID=2583587 RepID=A0A5B7ST92_9FLAO|nr:outer membrane beta-barrel protein [Aggregatimonas sangjinii]QCX01757.1 porin family protein [Aggregatimonas sangjinii]
MTKQLFLACIFLFALQATAQNKKLSVEANYSIDVSDAEYFANGVYDVGVKYRFINTPLVHLGLDLNLGFNYYNPDFSGRSLNIENKRFLYQPKVFAEFDLPFISKLHPSVGLGYSIVRFDTTGNSGDLDLTDKGGDGGFSFDAGLSYDITKRLFIQVKYDFINLNIKDRVFLDGEVIDIDRDSPINRIKFGIGFHF